MLNFGDEPGANGTRQICFAATRGLLVSEAIQRLQEAPIDGLILTDTIPVPLEKHIPTLKILGVAPLLGEAIKRIHRNESVSRLFV